MIAKNLQMPAYRGLGELEHGPDLIYGELVTLEQEQYAASRRVGESGHAVEDRRGRFYMHPYIRI
jgi:hypothetical protein